MPSEKSTQFLQNQQTSDPNVELITPLKVRSHGDPPDSSRPFRLTGTPFLLFLIGLAVMAAGGVIFIRHVAKHPVTMSEKVHRSGTSETRIPPKKEVSNTTAESKLQDDSGIPSASPALEPQQSMNTEKQAFEKEKAEELDAVNRLVASGSTHEKNGRFAFALTDYREALKLDPESKSAQTALNRVKEKIVSQQFQKLMSYGLRAYHDGRFQSARKQLLRAKSLRPDSREAKNALLQVDEAIRLTKIENLRQKAFTAEQTEDWENALKAHLAVLKIDPNISFAIQGKERVLDHIRVAKRIGFFLENPNIMTSNPQLQNAILVIEEAERLQPRGPKLSQRLGELKALIDAARTPVKVTIESDNLTEIAVYKVGKLGRFTTRELSLRPGSYTVVGSRDGYKDVRKNITVKPRQKTLRVKIICKNKV